MNRGLRFGIGTALFLFCSTARADIEYWKVVEVTGAAQMREPAESAWKDLSAPFYLKRGSLIRTGKEASVDLCLDRQWDSFLRLNENSEMEFSDQSLNTVRLLTGSLFALLEEESSADFLSVLSADREMRLSTGGMSVAVLGPAVTLRVFGESVELFGASQRVGEGWEWAAGRTRRMDFSDYSDWQQWVRKNYDRKDKYFLKRSL